MKNEDRIVELLAESLKRQDMFVEEMKQMRGDINEMRGDINEMRGDINEMRGGIGRVVASVDALTDIVKAWMEKTKKIDDLEERLRKVEQKTSHL